MMKKQSGAVLIVSLVILIIMTIIGLAAIRTSGMQEKMTSNIIDRQLAFQAAEFALRNGENAINMLVIEPEPKTSPAPSDIIKIWTEDGDIDPDLTNAQNWWQEPNRNLNWWQANGEPIANVGFSTDAGDFTILEQPRYIVEYLEFVKDDLSLGTGVGSQSGRVYYRITARASGAGAVGSTQSRVLLQSTFAKRF